jgi:membrane-associated phospholipid phosphatase
MHSIPIGPRLILKGRLGLTLVIGLGLAAPTTWADADGSRARKGPADRAASTVASTWFDTLYDVVKSEATAPPPASRIYGISAVALYEAVAPGARHHRSLAGQLHGLNRVARPRGSNKKYHWPAVANAALARTIRGLFPSLKPENVLAINALEQSFAAQFQAEVEAEVYERSVTQGQAVADAILAWAATDGYSTYNNCPYLPNPVAGAWEPTPPAFASNPLQPCWGLIRPMVLRSGGACPPPGHPAFSSDSASEFSAAAFEVYNTGLSLTDEQETIAVYWADAAAVTGTPPGHWIALVGQIARNDGLSLSAAAEAFARVGIAVHDAFIQCWFIKYVTNLQRPVTYIRNAFDATWLSHIGTPPFPSYTSGHSTQSGAAAAALTAMFGKKAFTDTLHADHHLMPAQEPRSFASFDEAAAEAAISRLYGGIHYAFDNEDGLTCGKCIGRTINRRVRFTDERDDEDDDRARR